MASDATVFAFGASHHDVNRRREQEGRRRARRFRPSTLRDTLGLPHYAALDSSVPTGASGVGVAVIDSGIEPSANFHGRIRAFYDFTRGRPRRAALRRLRPRHAHRRPDRQLRPAVELRVPGRGARRAVRRLEGARQDGRRQDERRHQGDRVRDCEPRAAERPGDQPVARPSDLRAGRGRPARPGGRKGAAAGIVVVTSSGNLGQNGRTARSATPGSRRPGTRRRRSRSGRS